MKLTIDYEALARNAKMAARAVITMLTRAGLQPVEVASDGKSRRVAGVSFREVAFTFADSQTLALRVKATGDVYEARINGKVFPVRAQDDAAAAVTELALALDKSRAAFQKRQAALKMNPPEGIKTAAPRLREVLTQQIAVVDAEIEAATEELAAIQAA